MSTASAALTSTIFGNNKPCNRRWLEIVHSTPGNAGVRRFPTRAAAGSAGKQKKSQKTKGKRKEVQEEEKSSSVEGELPGDSTTTTTASSVAAIIDEVNPVGLGRKSRQIFDEVWRKFSGLGQISRTTRADADEVTILMRESGPMCEFAVPGAQNTTVLVVGATSRIGRLVVRKLMPRGYTVKALVRKAEKEVIDMLPTSVEIITGDVGEPLTLNAAIEGYNKIIYCATARSSSTGDHNRVDHLGVYNLTKAFQWHKDILKKIRSEFLHEQLSHCEFFDPLWFWGYIEGKLTVEWLHEKDIFSKKNHWNVLVLCNFGVVRKRLMLLLDSWPMPKNDQLHREIRKYKICYISLLLWFDSCPKSLCDFCTARLVLEMHMTSSWFTLEEIEAFVRDYEIPLDACP